MTLALPPSPPRRRIGLTPMIDVVFLLLVFFMLAARFGTEGALPVGAGGSGGDWPGPPRLVEVGAEGLWLNGQAVAAGALAGALAPLMAAPGDPVVLRPRADTDVGRLVTVIDALTAAGLTRLVVVE